MLTFNEAKVKCQPSWDLAEKAHRNQKRKHSGLPYFEHCKDVFTGVFELRERPEFSSPEGMETLEAMLNAALLHDSKEDCQLPNSDPFVSDEEIRAACGDRAFTLVCELTNPSKGSKASRKVRKQMDIDHLKVVSREAKMIKMIDRTCNLRDMRDFDNDFLRLYSTESRNLLEAVQDADEGLAVLLLGAIQRAEITVGL